MNKTRYRLVFNPSRAMLMAVAETVKSHAGRSAGETTASVVLTLQVQQSYTLSPVRFGLMLAFGLVVMIPNALNTQHAYADIIADHSASPNQRPIVLNAANQVPLVNIQTPSAAGVSRNTYSQFNVNSNGVILNNSRNNVQTQLGGYVQGNPYLATGTARIILNEVNSNNPSLLNGYIEVAGSRAQVVIANPAGISCNGCGFINANRATLTTGLPMLSGGNLIGYRVTGGAINILGNGLDASQTDYTDIIARAVSVNTGLWANTLNITAGTNDIAVNTAGDTQSTQVNSASSTGAPSFAIDVAALGGMYAGKIHLIGTEAGVGVRNAGSIGASAGEVTITSAGLLINSGNVSAQTDTQLQAAGITNSGTLNAQSNLSANSTAGVTNTGLITARREFTLDSAQALDNAQGTLRAQRLALTASALNNTHGTIEQTGLQAFAINAQHIDNSDTGAIGTLPISSVGASGAPTVSTAPTGGNGGTTSTPPSTATGSGSTITTTPVPVETLAAGYVNIAGDLQNQAGQLIANGNTTLTANNGLTNSSHIDVHTLTVAGNSLDNSQGKLWATDLNLNVAQLNNTHGQLTISGHFAENTNSIINDHGEIKLLNAQDLNISLSGNLDNTAGTIAANSNTLNLTANHITNTDGTLTHAGTGELTLNSTQYQGEHGTLQSNGHLNLTADTANLNHANTSANQITLSTDTLTHQGGHLVQTGTAATNITASTALDNAGGTIASNGSTTFTLGTLNNQGGTLQAAGTANLTLNAIGAVDNSLTGTIQARGNVNLTAERLNNAQGQLVSNLALHVQTNSNTLGIDNHQGLIASNQALTLQTATLNNAGGKAASVQANADLTVTHGSIDNTAGTITAAQQLNLQSVGLDNTDGSIAASTASIDTQQQSHNNLRGTLFSTQALTLNTGALTNHAGLIQSGSALNINTHGQILTNQNSGNNRGILSQSSITLHTGDIDNQAGTIGAKQALTIDAAHINNNTGNLSTEADLSLTSTDLSNRAGRIIATQDQTLTVSQLLDNHTGLILAGHTLTLNAGSIDNSNTKANPNNQSLGIEGQSVFITTNQLNNSTGSIAADAALHITDSGSLNNTQGRISSADEITIADGQANANSNVATKTLDITNTGGLIIAQNAVTIDGRSLNNGGSVLSQGELTSKLTSNYTHTAASAWQANHNARFETTGILTNQAQLSAGETLTLQAATINNEATGEIKAGAMHLIATDSHTLTNRGLIDSGDTFIDTIILNNIGTGRIYGDHIAINATTLNNQAETLNNVTQAGTIAARNRLDIGATNITNQEGALLFSAGDMMIGGSLDATHTATGVANSINNISASIEALSDLTISANTLINKKQAFALEKRLIDTVSSGYWEECDAALDPDCDYFWGKSRLDKTYQDFASIDTPSATLIAGGNLNLTVQDTTNLYSTIAAGRDLHFIGSTLTNTGAELYQQTDSVLTKILWHWNHRYHGTFTEASSSSTLIATAPATISAGGTLTGSFTGNIDNTSIREHTALTGGSGATIGNLSTGSVTQTASGASTAQVNTNTAQAPNIITHIPSNPNPNSNSAPTVVSTITPNVTLPTSSLFHINSNPNTHYLIETDPRFANYRNWLSSDAMLQALNLDPALQTARLGDGFYEQKLIREQINALTGQRFLIGYADDESQYQALMSNAVTAANSLQLTSGIALTAAQVAQLTSDIVWLVEQTVILPNGNTTQALVPQVYVRLQPSDLQNNGALIAANTLRLNTSGDTFNSGSMAGRNLVSITANNINVIGGQIQAGNQLSLDAKHDINIESTLGHTAIQQNVPRGSSQAQLTMVNRVAGLYVTNPNGILVAIAGNDINLNAAEIINMAPTGAGNPSTNTSQTLLKAGHDINIGTITQTTDTYGQGASGGRRGWRQENSTQEIGSSIQTTGDITLIAGQNLNIKAGNITSTQGALTGIAGNSINIEAGLATYEMESYRKARSSGFMSSKSSVHQDKVNDTEAISGNLSADSITLNAGYVVNNTGNLIANTNTGNLNVQGSNVVATNDINLNATGDIDIVAATDTHEETHYYKKKTSGFSASGSSVSYGSSNLRTTNDSQSTTNVGSTIGSVEGDVNINAGKNYSQTGSDVLTPAGDINITAQQVNIINATDTYDSQQTMKYKQSGITLAISSPVISAIQTTQQMRKAANNTSDGRMKALAAGTAALAASNALDAVSAGQAIAPTGNTANNAANQVGGINVSLSIGTSKSSSKTTQTNSTAKSSTLNAGGDINITATGASQDSDINVIGSTIKAANDVTLKADDQINLQAAQNVDTLNSTNKGSGASLGIGFSLGGNSNGFTINAGVSGSKGKTNGNGSTWTETQIQAGSPLSLGERAEGEGKVTLQSGTDTNLIGAQVIGNQVIANVGTSGTGNLNIESLQDTDQYKDKQSNFGVSVSLCIPPFCYGTSGGSVSAGQSKTKSNYQSVNEQSGILAGDGGFQVNVKGNTNLKGAVIASTDQAVNSVDANGKPVNSLITQTLTTSNIENSAEYSAKGVSLGAGINIGLTQNNQPVAGVTKSIGWGSLSDDANSVTVSAVSVGNLSITDNISQQALTGKSSVTTVANLNRDVKTQLTTDAQGNVFATAVDNQGNALVNHITPIFDTEKVRQEIDAQLQITQAFDKTQQQFRMEINKKVDAAKAEKDAIAGLLKNPDLSEEQRMNLITQGLNAQKEIEQLENMGLVFSAVASGLSAPTNNIGGIIANSLAPAAANQIGQYFKDHGTEGSATHILAHGVLAGAVAALGGNNLMGAALSAMGGEMVAPLVADFLYGKPSEDLSAEQKSTVSAIASLGGMATGASVSGNIADIAQANLAAQNAVDNNWGAVGHYSTMATVLYLAGLSPKDAKAVALAAWGPDTDKRNAMNPSNVSGANALNSDQQAIHLLDSENDPAKVVAKQQALAEQVRIILLTIKQYENDPTKKAAYLTTPSVQNTLHAFGDAFAHVEKDGTHYPSGEGHLSDRAKPDDPNTHANAYKQYVNTLFSVAAQVMVIPRVNNGAITNLVNQVTAAASEDKQIKALDSAIGSIPSSTSSSLVNSPVGECGFYGLGCQNKPIGSQVNPQINSVYGVKK
jgi:filamentous hemagglutinin